MLCIKFCTIRIPRDQSNMNLYRGSTSCLCVCVCGCVCMKRMALASGHWLEKEMRGTVPSPRWVMSYLVFGYLLLNADGSSWTDMVTPWLWQEMWPFYLEESPPSTRRYIFMVFAKVFKLASSQDDLLIFFLRVQENSPVYYNDFHMLTGTNHWWADGKEEWILMKSSKVLLVKPIKKYLKTLLH